MNFATVCSGIEAPSQAWEPLGWKPVWFSEIEPFPCQLLAALYGGVPNLGDMTRFEEWLPALLSAVELLAAGTPCQAFSFSGKRLSLKDARGNLTLILILLLNAIDSARHDAGRPPALLLWENVPGVFSADGNAFGCFLAGLAGEDGPLRPPGGRWTNAGYVRGPRRSIAWRVFDAQYFGVAQRRERVFLVASPRGGPDPEEILFERAGLRRDSAPRREAGKGAAPHIAGCLGGCGQSGGYRTTDLDGTGAFIPEISGAIRAQGQDPHDESKAAYVAVLGANGGPPGDAHPADVVAFDGRARGDDGRGYGRAPNVTGEISGTLDTVKPPCVAFKATGSEQFSIMYDCAPPVCASSGGGAGPPSVVTREVSHCLNAGGMQRQDHETETLVCHALRAEGCEDGTGRGTPILPVPLPFDDTQITSPANRSRPKQGDPSHPLTASGRPPAIAFPGRLSGTQCGVSSDFTPPLGAQNPMAVAFPSKLSNQTPSEDVSVPLEAGNATAVATRWAVRRLMPIECERLMGCRDGYTALPGAADTPRYKALGNSIVVPVLAWIGRRIDKQLTH